jgi:hypothetical protein
MLSAYCFEVEFRISSFGLIVSCCPESWLDARCNFTSTRDCCQRGCHRVSAPKPCLGGRLGNGGVTPMARADPPVGLGAGGVTGGVTPVARTSPFSAGKLQQRGETQRSRSMARRGSQVHGKANGGVMPSQAWARVRKILVKIRKLPCGFGFPGGHSCLAEGDGVLVDGNQKQRSGA